MSTEGVKCEDCGDIPDMVSQTIANDEVLWMLICDCGRYKAGREPRRSQYAAICEWESSGYKSAKAVPSNCEITGDEAGRPKASG